MVRGMIDGGLVALALFSGFVVISLSWLMYTLTQSILLGGGFLVGWTLLSVLTHRIFND